MPVWQRAPRPRRSTGYDRVTGVLVIGAAGKTGRAVTRALLARGVRVRAAVRPGSQGMPYAAELASPVTVELTTGLGLGEAMVGVDAVYHLAPNVHPDEVGIATRVVESARAAGVSRFVFHSVLHPEDASMPHHVRKAEAEKVIRTRLSTATVLRPAAYGQNLLDAALLGRMAVPYSIDAPFTNVDLDDVAEVAALILTGAGHAGATYELCGPESLSVREQARIASEVLGHPVDVSRISLEEWAAGPGSAMSEQAREDLLAMFRAYDRDGLSGDATDLERLLGRPATPWRVTLGRAA